MKKFLTAAVAALVVVSVLASAGCGGDTAKAQEYMEEADAAQKELSSKLNELSRDTTALVTAALQGNVAAITQEDLTRIAGMVGTFEPEIARVKDLYARITALDGVDDYAAYAESMMKALDAEAEIVAAGGAFLAELEPYLKNGDVAGLTSKIESSTEAIIEVQGLQTASDEAYAEAEKIKKEKNLGQ